MIICKIIMSVIILTLFIFIFSEKKKMSSFSPFTAILNQNKLTGPNYVDWKRYLDIVLTTKEHKYVLTQTCPDFPNSDTPLDEHNQYDRWHKSNDMAKCYIMASILQHHMKAITLASDIILSLKEMFGIQGRSARQDIMRTLLNTQLAEGTPIRDHCLRMISCLNELEILGAEIDADS